MSRKSLLTILIFFAALASFWFFSLRKELKKTQEIVTDHQQQATDVTTTKVVTRSVASEVKSQRRQQLEAEINTMQQALSQEQQKLAERNRTLSSLASQQQQQIQQSTTDYTGQINERDARIQDLLSGMRDYRRAEQSLSERAAQDLRGQDAATKAAIAQLDDNIRIQEQMIQQTQADLDYWKINFNYVTEQEQRLAELTPLLEQQQQRLADMRAQRLELSSNLASLTQSTNSDVQAAADDYSDSQDQIYDEVRSLREEIAQLEQQQNQSHMSRISLASQVAQARRSTQAQAAQVQSLQASIEQKKAELNQLRE